jgi:short-subunit dehydrogenase
MAHKTSDERIFQDQVVVITGASSGIGKITAIEFAKRGANVVLAARREFGLEKTARECEGYGVQAIAVPTDVSKEEEVQNLATRAIAQFGHIDIWINNAGVYMMGEIKDTPVDAMRRLIDINFFGMVHGCKAALPHMLERGKGQIINTGSQAGKMAYRYAATYCASKFALTAFTDALRQELYGTGIDVSIVMPNSTDTPLFHYTANFSGRVVKPMDPISAAQDVADVFIRLAQTKERESYVTAFPRALAVLHTVAPGVHDRIIAKQTDRSHFKDEQAQPTKGNLFHADPSHTGVSGGWIAQDGSSKGKKLGMIAALAIPVIAGYFAWKKMSERDEFVTADSQRAA